MASLLTIAECRALVKTALTDAELQSVIDRAEGMITARIGAAQDDANSVTITETVSGSGEHLFVKVPYSTVVSIVEDGVTVDSADYRCWGTSGMIEHLPEETDWGDVCAVTYKPVDQRDDRIQAAIDLVRLMVQRTAMSGENIAGEYSYTAPDWEKEIHRVLRKLSF